MNVADLAQLTDVASVMRGNGIHRAQFHPDGSLAECELDSKYSPPPVPAKPMTPEEQELAKRALKAARAAAEKERDAILYLASEGYYPNDLMNDRATGAAEELNT